MKSPLIIVQVEDKGTNTDLINIITQEDEKPIEVKTYLDVAVQTIEIPSDDFVANSTTSVFEANQENATHMTRENQNEKTPYRHLNHKSGQLSQFTYFNHSERKQQI